MLSICAQNKRRAALRLVVRVLVLLCLLTTVAPLIAAPRELQLLPAPGQQVEFDAGHAVVFSRGRYVVAAEVEGINRKNAWVGFDIVNNSDKAVTVTEDSVTASDGSGSLVILKSAAVLKKEKNRQVWEDIGAGVTTGLNDHHANQAGDYTTRGTYSGRAGSTSVRGSYTASGTDQVAVELARDRASRENQQTLTDLERMQSAREDVLANTLFRAQTIRPGESYYGRLQVVLPKAQKRQPQSFGMTITVGTEKHQFIVVVDGAPTPAMLQTVAALPRLQPQIDAILRRFVVIPQAADDTARLDRVAVFDIAWTLNGHREAGPIKGMLQLRDGDGLGVDLFWEISAENAKLGRFFEEGTQQTLWMDNEASEWLLQQAEIGALPELSFVIGQPESPESQ